MTATLDDEHLDLERRLRESLAATIPRLLDDERTQPDLETAFPEFGRAPHDVIGPDVIGAVHSEPRRSIGLTSVAAACLVVVGIGGLMALRDGSTGDDDLGRSIAPTPVVTQLPGQTTVPAAPPTTAIPGTVLCHSAVEGEPGCQPIDALPVVRGASDFYVPADGADVVEVKFHLDYFEGLTRCAELSPDGTACERLEGIAGVALVDVAVSGGGNVEVGTTFTTVTPQGYAEAWGPTQGGRPTTPVVVRGHDGVSYMNETRPALVWEERPGVLVWLAVSADLQDRLGEFADGITSTPGPANIPDRMVVPLGDSEWDVWSNDGDGLIVARSQGRECVGYGYVEDCGDVIGDRVVNRTTEDGGMIVVGSTPGDVVSVEIVHAGGVVPTETVEFGPYESRFFRVDLPGKRALSIRWLNATGEVVDEASIEAIHGWISPDGGAVALIDASGIPGRAEALIGALGDRGVVVRQSEVATNIMEQTMLMPISRTAWTDDLAQLVGIDGYDTWTPSLIGGELPPEITDVIVLGSDGGPDLPLPLPSGVG